MYNLLKFPTNFLSVLRNDAERGNWVASKVQGKLELKIAGNPQRKCNSCEEFVMNRIFYEESAMKIQFLYRVLYENIILARGHLGKSKSREESSNTT
jgi:hypothetical protein